METREFSLSLVVVPGVTSLKAENRFLLQFAFPTVQLTYRDLEKHPCPTKLSLWTWQAWKSLF